MDAEEQDGLARDLQEARRSNMRLRKDLSSLTEQLREKELDNSTLKATRDATAHPPTNRPSQTSDPKVLSWIPLPCRFLR